MRRGLGLVLALGLLVGGAAACSDDDDGGEGDGGSPQESTTTAGGSSETPTPEGGGAEAANDAIIQEYCDAAEANNAALDAATANPGDEAAEDALAAASERLGEASDAVSPVVETFTPEQQAQFEECQS